MLRRTPHPRPAKFAACAPVSRLNWRRRWNRSTSICVFLNRESQNRLLQLRPLNEAGTVFCLFRLRKKSNAEGGGAFNPRKKPTESSGASAPEGCLPPNSHEMSSFSASSIDQRWFAPTMGKPEQVSISCDLPHRRGGLLAFAPGSARFCRGPRLFLTWLCAGAGWTIAAGKLFAQPMARGCVHWKYRARESRCTVKRIETGTILNAGP